MKEVSDLERTVISLKAGERMIAFVGFGILLDENRPKKDGVLKISSFSRSDGSGYLTLTFVVDTEKDQTTIDHLARVFKDAGLGSMQARLGHELEMIVSVPLDLLARAHDLYVAELDFYFRQVRDREKLLVEQKVIPALRDTLHCVFEPVEWLMAKQPDVSAPPARAVDQSADNSVKALFRKWFGSRRS